MQKLGVSVLAAILPVVLMGGVVYGADPKVTGADEFKEAEFDAAVQDAKVQQQIVEELENQVSNYEEVKQQKDQLESYLKEHQELTPEQKTQLEGELKDKVDSLNSMDQAKSLLDVEKQELTEKQALADKSAKLLSESKKAEQKTSILPSTADSIQDCKILMNQVHMNSDKYKKDVFEARQDGEIRHVLGCGIKTGDISLWMVPYYIRFILEFILQLGGLVAVGGIIYGGYLYLFAGLSDDKDRGKKAILYGVGGIVLAMTAWALVNIVISVVTA